jgi:hypothetical protein
MAELDSTKPADLSLAGDNSTWNSVSRLWEMVAHITRFPDDRATKPVYL